MTDPLPRLDIEIRLLRREDTTYPVEITLGGEQVFRGPLTSAITSITTDGRCLFDTLFADATLRNAWAEARGRSTRRRVRLGIDPAATELHTLPWEQLTDGNVVLAAHDDTPLSRYLPIRLPWAALSPRAPCAP